MKTMKSKLTVALMAAGLSLSAAAADIKVAYDADPVSLDPHEQLSGGTLQMSHMVFDPLSTVCKTRQISKPFLNRTKKWSK